MFCRNFKALLIGFVIEAAASAITKKNDRLGVANIGTPIDRRMELIEGPVSIP